MVIKGKSIKHAKAHARHLMRADQNDRVEILELDESGASPTLEAIFTEYQALAETLTRSQKGLYIAAINSSHDETLTPEQWTQAVDLLEQQLKLDGQPRTVILHEKKGASMCMLSGNVPILTVKSLLMMAGTMLPMKRPHGR